MAIKPTDTPQIDRFKQMARELGCDEDMDAFREKLKQVARHKPKDSGPESGQSDSPAARKKPR